MTNEEILKPFIERPFRHTEIVDSDNALKAMQLARDDERKQIAAAPARKKRLFEILDDMNQLDGTNGTRLVEVSNNFISADKVKKGALIGMGVPYESMFELAAEKKIAFLVLVDTEEFHKRSS